MQGHPIHDSAYSWTRLLITLMIGTIGSAGIWSIIVIMPAVEADFGASRADASLIYTITMVAFGAGNLFLGRVIDRFGVSKALVLSAVLNAIGFVGATLAANVTQMALVHGVVGFGAAIGFGPLVADISHWFLRRRGIAVAVAASANYLAGAVWPLLLAGVLADSGWRAVYYIMAAVSLVGLSTLGLFLRRKVPPEATLLAEERASQRIGSVSFTPAQLQWLLVIAGIACCVAMSMPQVHIVAFCVSLGYGPVVGAEMLSLMLLGGVASRLLSGLLADRLGGIRTLLIGSIAQCVALLLYLPSDGLTPLYVVSLVFGLSQGGIVPSYAVIVREYLPAREAGQRVGFVLMATTLGMALGGWMSGWIYDVSGSYEMAFLNGVAWNLLNIAIAVMVLLSARPRRDQAIA
jgi:MFS family permease